MNIRFLLASWDEMVEAGEWYDRRTPGQGDKFLDAVTDTLARIKAGPEIFPKAPGTRRKNIRRARVEGYSYDVIFVLENATGVKIIAVAHLSRRAGYWRKRL